MSIVEGIVVSKCKKRIPEEQRKRRSNRSDEKAETQCNKKQSENESVKKRWDEIDLRVLA